MRLQSLSFKPYVLCGLMAGIVEVIWAYFYANTHMIELSRVSVEITRSIIGTTINSILFNAIIGLTIHIVLSIIIGLFYALLVSNLNQTKYFSKTFLLYFYSVAMLICIWWLAYFVLLPVLNNNFILLVPASSAIYSKILFGITMATFFIRSKN